MENGIFCPFLFILVLVLLSASVERFNVSRMRDFFSLFVIEVQKLENVCVFSFAAEALLFCLQGCMYQQPKDMQGLAILY